MHVFLIFLVPILLLGLCVELYKAFQRKSVLSGEKNATIRTIHLYGVDSFTIGAQIMLELLPTELSLTQDEKTSASLPYSKITEAGKGYIQQIENSIGSTGLQLENRACFFIRYTDESNIKKELRFSYDRGVLGDVKFFIKMLQERIPLQKAVKTQL